MVEGMLFAAAFWCVCGALPGQSSRSDRSSRGPRSSRTARIAEVRDAEQFDMCAFVPPQTVHAHSNHKQPARPADTGRVNKEHTAAAQGTHVVLIGAIEGDVTQICRVQHVHCGAGACGRGTQEAELLAEATAGGAKHLQHSAGCQPAAAELTHAINL